MSKDINKKLLLGSALAGLMVAGPGLSVTTGKFFQTAKLEVGYSLAQAGEDTQTTTPPPSTGPSADDTTTEGDPSTRGKRVQATDTQAPAPEKTGEKSCGAGKTCGAGSCGSGH